MWVSDRPPREENRYRKHQWLGDDPRKSDGFAAEARVDLADQESPDDPPLDLEATPKHRPLPCSGRLGRRVLARAHDQQPGDAVGEQTARENHAEGDDPFGVERVI